MPSHTAAAHDDWDAHWDQYADSAAQNPAQALRHELIAELLRQREDGLRILDIGSGQGDLLARLATQLARGTQFLGVELSASGVRIAQQKVPEARFVVADLFEPPPTLEAFAGWATDAVCSEVLEHVDDPVAFLRRAAPYLATGARLIVTVPAGPMSAFDCHIGHRRHFTRSSLSAVLQAAGFTVECVHRAGFPFFNLYRLLVIARGERLAVDVRAGHSSALASLAMRVFHGLFRLTARDSAFGWQLVAVAHKLPA